MVRAEHARPAVEVAGLARQLVRLPGRVAGIRVERALDHELVAHVADRAERAVGVHEREPVVARVFIAWCFDVRLSTTGQLLTIDERREHAGEDLVAVDALPGARSASR